MLTNFFYSQSIAAALADGRRWRHRHADRADVVPVHRRRPAAARAAGHGLRLFLLAAPLTLVLFVLFPRIAGPAVGHAGRRGQRAHRPVRQHGAGQDRRADAFSPISRFRVRFEGAVPPPAALYWRGPVLGSYDGRRWLALGATTLPPSTRVAVGSKQVRYQMTQSRAAGSRCLRWTFRSPARRFKASQCGSSRTCRFFASQPLTERVRYDVASSLEYQLQADESPVVLRDWMALPPGFNPRTHEFASALRSRSTNDLDMVNAVLQMFREQKFSYTFVPRGSAATAWTTSCFPRRAGFCEHYAGAFVVIMRLLDIPARVVTGYQGGELNQVDGYLTVRQSDAHAWAEVWLAGRGWVRVDPTSAVAPDRVERNLATNRPRGEFGNLLFFEGAGGPWSTALQKWRDNRDAINNAWNQWVLDYTPARQRGFLQSLGIDDPDWGTLAALALTLGAAVMALIALPLVRNQEKTDPAERLYRQLCEELSRAGLPRAVHEGPLAYRTRLREAGLPPSRQRAALAFLELYETLRYGVQDANDKQNAHAQADLKQLKSLLKHSR